MSRAWSGLMTIPRRWRRRPAPPPVAAPRPAAGKKTVRPAGPEDIGAICEFLHRGMDARISAAQWQSLFRLPWTDAPDYGQVMEVDGRIVGYVGAIVAERTVAGRVERVCNLTSWCVDADHRNGLEPVSLLMPYLRRKDQTLTSLTPAPAVLPLFQKLGFKVLDTEKVIAPPLLNPATLVARGEIVTDPGLVRDRLSAQERTLFDHHLPLGCDMVLAAAEDGHAFLVVKRRVKRGIPLSEVLVCTNPPLAAALIEPLKIRILLRQRTVALVSDRRLFAGHPPRGLHVARTTLVRSDLPPEALDNLYSELAVLPV